MPIFDKSYQVMASPGLVAAHLTSSIGDGEACQNIKKDALYIVTHDGLALVYLIEPAPNNLSSVRLVVNDAALVRSLFEGGNVKEAWLKLISSLPPPTVDPDTRGVIAQRVAELVNAFKAGSGIDQTAPAANPMSVTSSPPTNGQPNTTAASAATPAGLRPEWPTSQEELRKSNPFKLSVLSTFLIIRVVLGLIVMGVLLFFGIYIRGQFNTVINALNTPLNLSGVNLNPDSNWRTYPINTIPNCTTSAPAGFTCYAAVQDSDATVTVVLGGVFSGSPVDLIQIEKDTFTALQQREPLLTKVKVYYNVKLPNQVDAIRRDMTLPVPNSGVRHFEAQWYFHYNTTLFELTVLAISQNAFNAQEKNIEALIKGMTVGP